MPSSADWANTGEIFLIRHPDVDYSTGRPIYIRRGYSENGIYLERAFEVKVSLNEVTDD